MILTITLNTSIDKRYTVTKYTHGTVMRVKDCEYTAGGKGINVSKNLHLLGNSPIVSGIIAGYSGGYIDNYLVEMGCKTDFFRVGGESRSCVNIFDESTGIQTELLEPGFELTAEGLDGFLSHYKILLDGVQVVSISGSVPKGCNKDIYNKLIEIANGKNVKVLLDTSGESLIHGVKALPYVIKPNNDEIEQLLGRKVEDESNLIAAAMDLHNMGIAFVVLSRGGDGSYFVTDDGVYKVGVPLVEAKNTVGCGDALLAGVADGIDRKLPIEDLIRNAVAVSVANAMDIGTGHFDMNDYNYAYDKITINKI